MLNDPKKVCTGEFNDKIKVKEEHNDFYEEYYQSTIIKKEIIYLNGVNFFNGVQGSGKTYLVKSIISNKNVDEFLNNVFWLETTNDMDFIIKFLDMKKILFDGLKLFFQNKLNGNYLRSWKTMCEKDHLIVNKERFDFKVFDPCLYDIIVLDDIATNQCVDCLLSYATVLRHLHCGLVFLGQTETILNKKYRDLLSLYVTFNTPDKKILNNKMRREVEFMISRRNNPREAVAVDLITEEIYYICAENDRKETKEDKKEEVKKDKNSDLTKFKEALDSFSL